MASSVISLLENVNLLKLLYMEIILSLVALAIVLMILLRILDFLWMCCLTVFSFLLSVLNVLWGIVRFIYSVFKFIYDVIIFFKTGGYKAWKNSRNQYTQSSQQEYSQYSSYSQWQNYQYNNYQQQSSGTDSTSSTDKETLYLQVLELSRAELNSRNLKRNYRRLVKKYHPDLHPGDKQKEEKFKLLTEAYDYFCERI